MILWWLTGNCLELFALKRQSGQKKLHAVNPPVGADIFWRNGLLLSRSLRQNAFKQIFAGKTESKCILTGGCRCLGWVETKKYSESILTIIRAMCYLPGALFWNSLGVNWLTCTQRSLQFRLNRKALLKQTANLYNKKEEIAWQNICPRTSRLKNL